MIRTDNGTGISGRIFMFTLPGLEALDFISFLN